MGRRTAQHGHCLVSVFRNAPRLGEADGSEGPRAQVLDSRRTQRRRPSPDRLLLCVGAGHGISGAFDPIRVDTRRQNRPRRAAAGGRRRQFGLGQAQAQVQRPRRLLAEAAGSRRVHTRRPCHSDRRIPDRARTRETGGIAQRRGRRRPESHLPGVRREHGYDAPYHPRAGRPEQDRGISP